MHKDIIINCDGAAVNKSSIRLLTTELQKYPNLFVFTNICAAHTLNNSTLWGLGDYAYVSVLRAARVFDAVRNRRLPDLAKKCIRGDIQPGQCIE